MSRGFSLLEVIIATAVLAGSAMVLVSLIGLGTRFGSKAEQRGLALNAAQTILEEHLLTGTNDDSASETTGVVEGKWPMAYRLTVDSLAVGRQSTRGQESSVQVPGVVRITVEVYDSEQAISSGAGQPLCKISRLVRSSQLSDLQGNAEVAL